MRPALRVLLPMLVLAASAWAGPHPLVRDRADTPYALDVQAPLPSAAPAAAPSLPALLQDTHGIDAAANVDPGRLVEATNAAFRPRLAPTPAEAPHERRNADRRPAPDAARPAPLWYSAAPGFGRGWLGARLIDAAAVATSGRQPQSTAPRQLAAAGGPVPTAPRTAMLLAALAGAIALFVLIRRTHARPRVPRPATQGG